MSFKKYNIKSRNIPIIFLTEIIGGMLFFLPILALYFEQNLFSITNVAIIFSVESFFIALLELPTGAIADLFGRKFSIILAHIFVLIALVFLSIGGSMIFFILYAVFNAIARSLTSGTYSAFIYDTLKSENKEKIYKKIFGTLLAFWPLGAAVGAIIGGHLANISLSLPVYATFIPIGMALILTLFLEEPNYKKEEHKNIFKQIFHSSKFILSNYKILILILSGFIFAGFGESMHGLDAIFYKFKEIPIVWFGYIAAVAYGLSSLGHYFSHNVSARLGDKNTLLLGAFLSPIFIILATLNTGFAVAALFVIPSIFFGLRNPIINHLINLEVESSKRATVLSIDNLLNNIGFVIAAPILGYLADLYTINTAFQISAVIVFFRFFVYLLLKRRNGA